MLFQETFYYDCSTRLETHRTSASLSMALTDKAVYLEVSPVLNCLFVLRQHSCREQTTEQSKESKGLCLLNSSFSWRERWDSLRHVTGKLFLLGLSRLLRGRCVPSGWHNHSTHSAVTTSTSAILRELWATHLLTHQVCSRDQTGGKWWWSWTRVYVAFETMWHIEETWGEAGGDASLPTLYL